MSKNKCKDCENAIKNIGGKRSHEVFLPLKDGTILITACRKHIKIVTDMFKKNEQQNRD